MRSSRSLTGAALAFLLGLHLAVPGTLRAQKTDLMYRPAPADNPLKGLVPYAGQGDPFPHSLEFWYFPMNALMTGESTFHWSSIDRQLDAIASRGCQTVFRVFMEYPGREPALPEFLVRHGVEITSYEHDGKINHTPDYDDPRVRDAMKSFIAALGKRYDGDPRVGFITMGILGHWGEWHTYPRSELFASEQVQTEVMDAFEAAFPKTKVLMRYPAGTDAWQKAPNHQRGFGYHDDSFGWATLTTGREEDSWFFQSLLQAAGPRAVSKWKTQPIGGEIRPEIWGCVFDNPSCAPAGQEFGKCVEQTHVSWLMDSGMFTRKATAERRREAMRHIRGMGYELFVSQAAVRHSGNLCTVHVKVTNRGVAPFYYDWPVEVVIADRNGKVVSTKRTAWRLSKVLPNERASWTVDIELPDAMAEPTVMIRVPNPMPGGKPLRFANETQGDDGLLKIN